MQCILVNWCLWKKFLSKWIHNPYRDGLWIKFIQVTKCVFRTWYGSNPVFNAFARSCVLYPPLTLHRWCEWAGNVIETDKKYWCSHFTGETELFAISLHLWYVNGYSRNHIITYCYGIVIKTHEHIKCIFSSIKTISLDAQQRQMKEAHFIHACWETH